MSARVLLVAWKGSTATGWVQPLTESGYTVLLEDTTGERAWRTAKERGIDVVIIDGQKKPSHGRQTGHSLRDTAKTRDIPIIWTNLDQEDSNAVQAEVRPDVTLVAPTDAFGTLAALQALGEKIRWTNGELFASPISQPLDEEPSGNGALRVMVTEVPMNGMRHPDPPPVPAAVPASVVLDVEPLPSAPPPASSKRSRGEAVRLHQKTTQKKSAAKKAVAKTPSRDRKAKGAKAKARR